MKERSSAWGGWLLFRVLVVDDEKEIRNGLVSQFPWNDLGVGEVYSADDGDTALEMIGDCKPDLVVTDIRMPRVSGLELVEQLGRDRFEGKVIVISGHEDFNYARQVMRFGVSDYLLKPLNLDEFTQSVAGSLAELRARESLKSGMIELHEHLSMALPKIRGDLLQHLIERPPTEGQLPHWTCKLDQAGLEWMADHRLRLMVVGIDDLKAMVDGKPDSEKELLLFSVGNILEYYLNDHLWTEFVLFRSRQDLWTVVVDCGGPGRHDAVVPDSVIASVPEIVLRDAKFRASVGFAASSGPLTRLPDMYREASDALMLKRIGKGAPARPAAPGHAYFGPLADPQEVIDLLTCGSEEDIRAAAADFPKLAASWEANRPKDMQQRTFQWILNVYRTAKKEGWKNLWWEQNPIQFWEDFERFDTLESLHRQVIQHLLDAAASMREQFGSGNQIVLEAERYIKNHYCDNITLQTVADEIHVTPTWLSKLFKRETGVTFLEYLTEVRLKQAAQLLQNVHLKIYQVCHLVGYQDPVYFAKLFKKQYGCNPQEYRSRRGQAGD